MLQLDLQPEGEGRDTVEQIPSSIYKITNLHLLCQKQVVKHNHVIMN